MEKKFITGQCPHCKTQLCIEDGEAVTCPSCDVVVTSDEIAPKSAKEYGNVFGGRENGAENGANQFAVYIENPASGLAYLENRFDTFDWEEYESNLVFDLDDIETVVEKNKVTNANNPDTWLLEFKSIIIPYTHKIHGIIKLADAIADEYNPLDLTNTFESFDEYLRIANALASKKDSVMKALESDIKFMEKFKAPSDILDSAKKEYEQFVTDYSGVLVVSKMEELPVVGNAIAKIQKDIADKLSKKGIDAEATYKEAVADYNDPSKSECALAKFQSLMGYKDSASYIKKINTLSNFNGVLEVNGKMFYSVTAKAVQTFDVKAPAEAPKASGAGCGKKAKKGSADAGATAIEPTYNGLMTSLFKIDEKSYDPQKPIVNKVSGFLTSYNSKLFYISEDREIAVINLNDNSIVKLDSGKLGSYDKNFIWGSDKKTIYIKKRLDARPVGLTKSGCGRKKTEAPKDQFNNFSLLKIDLEKVAIDTAVNELVDIMDVYGDYIFFTQSRYATPTDKQPKTVFTSYNLTSGEIVDMLGEDVCLVGAVEGKVVYSKFSPITYNMDLYVYIVETQESLLLENNIYEAMKIHDGKVLYTVGNFRKRSMFSIKLDGTERTEILLNVEKIQWFDKNWMYVVKGYSHNAALIKISYDGKKRVVIATGIKELIEMTAGYVYYINYNGYLCMVRTDGKKNKEITNNCDNAKVIINTDNIFLMNEEKMDAWGKVSTKSLYSMDLQGHNLKKVFYGLADMDQIDEQRIFFLQRETRKYKITTPQEKGDPIITYVSPMVETYYEYDKFTHEINKILVLGEPKEQTFEFKSGCGKKKINAKRSAIEEVTEKKGYERSGKMTPGQVAEEEKKKAEEKADSPLSAMQSVAGRGTNSNNAKTGCEGCSSKRKG